jgi:predicted RNA-binding Zn-ribbon protein involved in translation (DUF1610 family)
VGFLAFTPKKCGLIRVLAGSINIPMDRTSHTRIKTETAGLHVCRACGSGLVQPTRWEQAGDRDHWHLWRRCPECGWNGDAIHSGREIDAYDEVLEEGTQALAGVLAELVRENMQHVVDSLSEALRADLITADDFS